MPFTFSHPALILPVTYLPKKWYSLSALIVGSMTPDFEYFIRMRDYSTYSHTIDGAFWFDMPLGLLLLFVFHNLVRNTLVEHLPFSLNIRFSATEKFNWNKYFQKNVLVVLLSLFIGIASHIFLDSFTHEGEYFANAIPFLKEDYHILNHQISGATIGQYVGSVIGGIIMLIAVFNLPEGANTKRRNIFSFWLVVSLITFTVLTIRLYIDVILHQSKHEDVIVTTISGGLIGIICMSVYLRESNKKQLYKRVNKIRNNAMN